MTSGSHLLLSTAYLPPVQYISKFLSENKVLIEIHENYQKQSYRNRCYIYGANGRQCLVIPIVKAHGEKTPITRVEIDNQSPWQKIHIKSIQSAYLNSPFYEFYADEFNRFYTQKSALLIDWNSAFLKYILKLLNLETDIKTTTGFEKAPVASPDYRQTIHPKPAHQMPDKNFLPVPYIQVFRDRYGFIPNLSIIDLLFNEGQNAREILVKSIR
jgi:hypothetical protein